VPHRPAPPALYPARRLPVVPIWRAGFLRRAGRRTIRSSGQRAEDDGRGVNEKACLGFDAPSTTHFVWSRSPTSWGRMTSRAERINKEKSKMPTEGERGGLAVSMADDTQAMKPPALPATPRLCGAGGMQFAWLFPRLQNVRCRRARCCTSRNPATGIESLRCRRSNGRKPKSCASPSARFFPSARAKARKVCGCFDDSFVAHAESRRGNDAVSYPPLEGEAT
jgi:hypothetical protein